MPYAPGPDLPPPAPIPGQPVVGPSQSTLDILAGKPLVAETVVLDTPVTSRSTTVLYIAGALAVVGFGWWLSAAKRREPPSAPKGRESPERPEGLRVP